MNATVKAPKAVPTLLREDENEAIFHCRISVATAAYTSQTIVIPTRYAFKTLFKEVRLVLFEQTDAAIVTAKGIAPRYNYSTNVIQLYDKSTDVEIPNTDDVTISDLGLMVYGYVS